jgi:hypothetical protein
MSGEAVATSSSSQAEPFDLELVFRAQFAPIVRVIGRVVRDHGRAEELAVEAFLRLWRKGGALRRETPADGGAVIEHDAHISVMSATINQEINPFFGAPGNRIADVIWDVFSARADNRMAEIERAVASHQDSHGIFAQCVRLRTGC